MEVVSALKDITDQWAVLFAARMLHTVQMAPADLASKVDSIASRQSNADIGNALRKGLKMCSTNTVEQINMMSDTVESLIMQFHSHPNFCKMFNSLINATHNLLIISLQQDNVQVKSKALHTEKIVSEEVLSDLEKLECIVFKYLSEFLLAAAKCSTISFDPINLDIVTIVFHYLKHDQPNAVRASAGDILSALSASPRHSQMINDMFWQQFLSCKKDDDYRNFASWIDGVVKLKLALTPEPLEKVSIDFLTKFIENEKKIERGVLRMKFLDALSSIIKSIVSVPAAENHQKLKELLNGIWDIALNWSSKGKHTDFCYEFMSQLLSNTFPSFYIEGHGKQFLELLAKYAKSSPIPALKLIAIFIQNTPKQFYETRVDEFTKLVNTVVIPLLFSSNEKKRSLHFETPEQIQVVLKIMNEIGIKQMIIIIDFVRSVLVVEEPNNDHKKVRMVCIQVLGELSNTASVPLSQFNTQLFPLLEPIILGTNPDSREEILYAIPTFPLIHSMNEIKLDQIAQVLFEVSLGSDPSLASSAMRSITRFTENLVTLNMNSIVPIRFINTLLDQIPSSPRSDVTHKLLYITGIATSIAFCLSKQQTILDSTGLQGTQLKAEQWSQMRFKLDSTLIPLLFNPDNDLVSCVVDLLKVFLEPSISKLDSLCGNECTYTLSKWISGISEKKEFLTHVHDIPDNNLTYSNNLIKSTIEFWSSNRRSMDPSHSARIMSFLFSILRTPDESMKRFTSIIFETLRVSPGSQEIVNSLLLTDRSLIVPFIKLMNNWITNVGLQMTSYWQQYTIVLHTFASRPTFVEDISNNRDLGILYETYLSAFWQNLPPKNATAEFFAINEKCYKILTIFAENSPSHFSSVVPALPASISKFIESMKQMAPLSLASLFSTTYPETYLNALRVSFGCLSLDSPEPYISFLDWLKGFIKLYENKEQIQSLVAQMLTILLKNTPSLLRHYFKCSFLKFDLYASHFILSISNVFKIREDFVDAYENGLSIVLSTVILHITSDNVLSRQAAHKLLCLLLTQKINIFTIEAPRPLVMAISSRSPSGYVTQAQHFIDFASNGVTSSLAMAMFAIFAEEFSFIEHPQNPLLRSLHSFIPAMMKESDMTLVTPLMLFLTTKCELSSPSTASLVSGLWFTFYSQVKEVSPKRASELLKIVFDFGKTAENLKSINSNVSIHAIVSAFHVFPEETTSLLLPVLSKFDRKIPSDLDTFLEFLKGADIDFEPSQEEILAANALSQILLLISDRQLFSDLFTEKLPSITFFAIMMYHLDQFNIGPFRPLLDTLLDASLFRFAQDNKMFSSNLAALQGANLIHCATHLEQQFQIVTVPPAKKMLAYDAEAIKHMATLMCQAHESFKSQFFELILANAFQVKQCERAMEPFIMMMALSDQLTTRSVYYILLFTLYALKNNRTELMDALVDIVHQRLIAPNLSEQTFTREALPVIIIFLLYITIDIKRSFSMHLIRILSDVCKKLYYTSSATETSQQLNNFFQAYNGDEYIASLFVKFIIDLQTLGDVNAEHTIKCLYELSRLLGLSSTPNNWCYLFALMIDYIRSQIAVVSNRPIKPVIDADELSYNTPDSFVDYIITRFQSNRQQQFIINYLCSLFKVFKSLDLHKDLVAMKLIEAYLRRSKFEMNPTMSDNVLKLLTLVNLTADEEGRKAASAAINFVISQIKYRPNPSSLSLVMIEPQLKQVTQKVIGYYVSEKRNIVPPESLPIFIMFNLSGMETSGIIDMMWEFITQKLREESNE